MAALWVDMQFSRHMMPHQRFIKIEAVDHLHRLIIFRMHQEGGRRLVGHL